MKQQPELKIEANQNGVTRIRCLYTGEGQKRAAFTLAAKLLPSIARLDKAIRQT